LEHPHSDRFGRLTSAVAVRIVPGMANGVLIDLSGVVYSGGAPLPGAIEAIERLNAAGLPHRFVTNTTSKPLAAILDQLSSFGLSVERAHIFTPAQAAVAWLAEKGYAPHLLVNPALEEDFADCPADRPKAVVVGDAGRFFTYERLNTAFRALITGAPFVALAANRVFEDADGQLSMDAGAFVTALEFSSGVKPVLMGKPAPAFFAAAAASMGLGLAEVAMIGDDAEADVAGALEAGVWTAILVRTGKYRAGDEAKITTPPSLVVDGIGEAIDAIIGEKA